MSVITTMQVLSENERAQVHERSLKLLEKTGMRVDTAWGRRVLKEGGAAVDEDTRIVRFPPGMVEEALRLTPRMVSLGTRRPGIKFSMNTGECTLCADGGAIYVYDAQAAIRRNGTREDWLQATRLIDALDEVGVYWAMVQGWYSDDVPGDFVAYWRDLFRSFSKHIQDTISQPQQTHWLLEILQVVFGDKESVRREKPLSLLLCPRSPLVLDGSFTDAYLETIGWDIPVALMPMPLMGATAPASLISTLLLANSEVLGMLCLVQVASPGTPCIYAPVPSVIDPRSGRYGSGAVEHALLGAAVTAMGRYYGLPVEAPTGGSDHYLPGIQATYERVIDWILPGLSWPDILLGPGLLGSTSVLSLEQILLDIEVYRRCRRIHQGIGSTEETWLQDVIAAIGPGGNFLADRSTRLALRTGEWYLDKLGVHDTYEAWESAGKPDILEKARKVIDQTLRQHTPLPLSKEAERELERIEHRARTTMG